MRVLEYNILYKNGMEDDIQLEVTEENKEGHIKVRKTVEKCMREGADGVITLGDGKDGGSLIIRVSDISRIKLELKTINVD